MAGPEAQAWQPEAGRRDWQTGRQLPYPLWRLRPVRPIPMPAAPQWLLGARDTTARRRSWQGEESFSVAAAVQRCSSRTEEEQPLTLRSDPVGFQFLFMSIAEAPRFASSISNQGVLVRMPLSMNRGADFANSATTFLNSSF